MDEKFVILVQKVPPGFQLTVHASYQCEDGHSWEAFGHYTADASGTLSCVVCIGGSHVQPADGSVEQVLKYMHKNSEKTRFSEKNEMIWRDLLLPIPTDPSLKVDVGRLQCPLMLVACEDDQNWPAPESAKDMKEMMERAGNSHLLTVLSYPKAGHLIEPPYTPHARVSMFKTVGKREKLMVLWGGETVEHSRAQEDAWRKMLVFLTENLFPT
ncbi:acyl-coenzyme A thioesterase 4-like, partial [Stegastes partitus]|uniref:Acyl-coenzyme A thioesterase 4-like n=1 Tax=Stegastes partitus TaxID=144197 RepID=A0A9Y4NKI3_9TELE